MARMTGAIKGLEHSSKPKIFTWYCLIVSILILAMAVASCGLIPGGKESHAVVKSFMEAAAAKDIDTAVNLFPSPATEALRKDIEEFILDNYVLFEGYQDVKMQSINVQFSDKGDTAEYGGDVTYAGDFKGWVEAELVKVGEDWKLTWINVEVSQEKLEDYQRRHGH